MFEKINGSHYVEKDALPTVGATAPRPVTHLFRIFFVNGEAAGKYGNNHVRGTALRAGCPIRSGYRTT